MYIYGEREQKRQKVIIGRMRVIYKLSKLCSLKFRLFGIWTRIAKHRIAIYPIKARWDLRKKDEITGLLFSRSQSERNNDFQGKYKLTL